MKKHLSYNFRVGRVEGGGVPQEIPPQKNMITARNDVNTLLFGKKLFTNVQEANERIGHTEILKKHEFAPAQDEIGLRP